jgi:hypothetical protein
MNSWYVRSHKKLYIHALILKMLIQKPDDGANGPKHVAYLQQYICNIQSLICGVTFATNLMCSTSVHYIIQKH